MCFKCQINNNNNNASLRLRIENFVFLVKTALFAQTRVFQHKNITQIIGSR